MTKFSRRIAKAAGIGVVLSALAVPAAQAVPRLVAPGGPALQTVPTVALPTESEASGGGPLIIENAFVSATGWVKPGDSYPFRVLVKNPTGVQRTGAVVTLGEVPGMTITAARTTTGTATLATGTVTWQVGNVGPGTAELPAVVSLVVEARAADFEADPEIVWKNLSTVARLTYTGGPTGGVAVASRGPKVIPPGSEYDTARYGDRPFPVVPVDYADFKHDPANSAEALDDAINGRDNPGSTFNLYQEMSLGQLFPDGDIPSLGVETRAVQESDGLRFSRPEPQSTNTCTGVTTVDPTTGEPSPLYTERISDGWYQLPGQRSYYGQDANGSALVGAVAGVGSLQQIDSGCGPAAKAAYDAAVVADPDIDYSDYDTNKDGVVDFFEVIFQGPGGNGESQTSPPPDTSDNIWPHSSSLEFSYTDEATGLTGYISDDQLKSLEGEPLWYTDESRSQMTTEDMGDDLIVFVRVGPYNVNPETSIQSASVISHEYGHSLGLPDFYSTGSRETYGDFNLMATDKSQHMDVYAKQELGWIVPRVLEAGETVTAANWPDSKVDIGEIRWVTPDGTPYTLSAANGDQGIRNALAYVAPLPGRQLLDPARLGDASPTQVWHSGSGNDFGCPPQGGSNLDIVLPELADVPAGTPVTLELKQYWDIEWDYDYGFVMTGVPGDGNTIEYTSKPSENGYTTPATQNPNANACQAEYGNGLTGSSGSYEAGTMPADRVLGEYREEDSTFLEDSYDISDLAGVENGVLRFSYATDPGLARPGWFIDDIVIRAGDEVIYQTDFESDGGPDDPRMYPGGCKEDLRTADFCTRGFTYVEAGGESPADHAYLMEMRDRSGFDNTGRGENDRDPIAFDPGLLLVYTDEAHGYGNVGTDDPPAQSPLDSQPQPGESAPDLSDATFTSASGDDIFSDNPNDPHIDNYSDPNRDPATDKSGTEVNAPWLFDYGCLTFDVQQMSGANTLSDTVPGDLTGTVAFTMGRGCAEFDYGLSGLVRGRGPVRACDPGFVPDPRYQDTATDTHEPRIRCIAWYAITRGTGDADRDGRPEYEPGEPVSRDQMASFVYRLAVEAGVPIPATVPDRFEDDQGNTHERAINVGAALGIIQGKGDLDGDGRDEYRPAEPVSRGQMAALIARLHQRATGSLPTPSRDYFDDDNGTTHEASINVLAELGVIQGQRDVDSDGDIDFVPNGNVTRGQMATFIANELGVLVRSGNAEAGGAEVLLDGTSVGRGEVVDGVLETNKQLVSLTANGCGLSAANVPVGDDGAFSLTLPTATSGECELSLDAVTRQDATAPTQSVRWIFTLAVS